MDNKNSTSTTYGVSFSGLLTIVFIVLKLTNVITWSWVWVLSPLWIPIALVILVAVIAIVVLSLKKTGNN